MNPKLRWLGLASTGLLMLGCNGGTGSGRPHAALADTASNLDSTTAAEVLMDKIARKGGPVPSSQDLSVDSANSAAAGDLRYYWTRVGGRNFHEFQVAAIAAQSASSPGKVSSSTSPSDDSTRQGAAR